MATEQLSLVLRQFRHWIGFHRLEDVGDPELVERFVRAGEEAAFATLVQRHSALVMGVCRRILHHHQDAEDAFQATFLVLARKAGAIRNPHALAGWLHAVAYRIAQEAKLQASRRRDRERQARAMNPPTAFLDDSWQELRPVLDEELHRLPEKYRLPLVLCYLEGQTQAQAAAQLGWPLGSMSRRLARGRELLRQNLGRRGVVLSGTFLAAALTGPAQGAAVSLPLVHGTVKAGLAFAAGKPAAASAHVLNLARRALPSLATGQLTLAVLSMLAAGCLTLAVFGQPDAGQEKPRTAPDHPAARTPERAAPPPKEKSPTRLTIAGRVVGANGKPVPGAQVVAAVLYQMRLGVADPPVALQGQADGQGRYRLVLAPVPAERYLLYLKAAAPGHALGAQFYQPDLPRPATTVQLPREQVAHVRLITLQGTPASGVKVRVELPNYPGQTPDGAPWPGPLITDGRGRLTLRAVGRGYRVALQVHDDRFARQRLDVEVGTRSADDPITIALAPPRTLEGMVTRQDTSQPLPGARVEIEAIKNGGIPGKVRGQTDRQGRYRIIPYEGNRLIVRVFPPEGVPYLPWEEQFDWAQGKFKRNVDFRLRRGVLVRGKVTEAGSGNPLSGAHVEYRARRRANPFYRNELLEYYIRLQDVRSGPDGGFQLAVPPGPGHLFVQGPGHDYLHAETSYRALETGQPGGLRYYPDALVPLDLKPGAPPVDVAVTLRRGVTVRGRVLKPSGQPVESGRCLLVCRSFLLMGYTFGSGSYGMVGNGVFELPGCDPGQNRPVFFLYPELQLGAVVNISGKNAQGEPITVRLAPCGSARVCFVDQHGRPWANQPLGDGPLFLHLHLIVTPGLTAWNTPDTAPLQSDADFVCNLDMRRYANLRTDAKGCVTFPTLIPGATYHIVMSGGLGGVVKRAFTLTKPAETVTLADIVVRRSESR
jgi:RNA polymerase sigma factor (sigma-70 family)